MPEYSVLIQYDKRDGIYVASIPELPGRIAHGKTQLDAINELNTAYELWVETALDADMAVPSPAFYAH